MNSRGTFIFLIFLLAVLPSSLRAQGSWMQVPTAQPLSPSLFAPVRGLISVVMSDTGNGFAVGYTDIANGISGVVRKTSGDPTWYILPVSNFHGLPPSHQLWAGVCVYGQNVWICGSEGRVYKSSDFGDNWYTSNGGIVTTGTLREIQILNARPFVALEGFVVGDNGKVYYTDTGGASWYPEMLPITVQPGTDFHALSYSSGGVGYWFAAGESHTFIRINRAQALPTDDLTGNIPGNLGTIHEINVRNTHYVWVIGESTIGGPLQFSAGSGNIFGNSPVGLPSGDFRAIFMGSTLDSMGWVGGPGPSMYYSLDHGLNWTLGAITPLPGRTLSNGVQDIHGHFVDFAPPFNQTFWKSTHAVGGAAGPSSEGWVLKWYPELEPDISATATSFDLGSFTCGPSLIKTFTVRNDGAAELEIASVFFSLPEFSLGSPPPNVIAPYDRASFNIRWTPAQPGPMPANAKMTIVSNDPVYPTWEVDLAGLFNSATVAVTNPQTVLTLCAGDSVDILVQATVSGNIDPVLLGVTHAGGAAGVRLVSPDVGTLLSGTTTLTFRFSASVPGPWNASYRLHYGDTLCPKDTMIVFQGLVSGAVLTPSPAIVDFGSICVGQEKDMSLTLTNTGSLAGSVTSYTFAGGRDAFPSQHVSPVGPIDPNDSRQYSVRFAPAAGDIGLIEGTYKLAVEPCGDSVTIVLRGIVIDPLLAISPPGVLALGPTVVGQPVDLPVTITNNGGVDITITGIGIQPSHPRLTLTGSPSLPRVLAPTQTIVVGVRFDPDKVESILGALVVRYSDPCADSIESMLTASSASPPTIMVASMLDMGEQACPGPLIDTLWVKNLGQGLLTLKRFTFSGRDSSHFSILGPAVPAFVAAGDSAGVRIACDPPAPGTSEAFLTIEHDDPKTSNISVIQLRAERIDVSWILEGDSATAMESCAHVGVSRTFTMRNTGTRPRTLTGLRVVGGTAVFSVTGPTLPAVLQPGATASFTVTFTPGGKADVSGIVELAVGPCDEIHLLALRGLGRAAELTITPSPLDFGSVNVGGDSVRTVRIANPGAEAVHVTSVFFRPPMPLGSEYFALAPAPVSPFTLNPGDVRNVDVRFSPQALSAYSGSLCVAVDAPCPDTLCVIVSGRGTSSGIGVSSTRLDIALDPCTLDERCESLDVINNGASPVTISGAVVDDPGWFTVQPPSALPLTVPPGSNAMFRICALPGFTGTRGSILRLATSDASIPELRVTVTAVRDSSAFSVRASALDFGAIARCEAGLTKTITIENTGTIDESIDAGVLVGPFTVVDVLPVAVKPGMQATLTVRFAPTSWGSFTDTLHLFNTRCGASTSVVLSGEMNEHNALVTPDPLTFGNVPVGSSAVRDVGFENLHLAQLRIADVRISAAADFSSTGVYPKTVPQGGTIPLPIQYHPQTEGPHNETACIIIDQPCPDTICVTLEGLTGDAGLVSSPAVLDFGDVAQCANSVLSDTVRNSGGTPIRLTAARIEGTHAANFELLNGITIEETLNPGAERVFDVRVQPASAADGPLDARLVLDNNGTPSKFDIPITARRVTLVANGGGTVDFGSVYAGTTTSRTVTLRNNGSAPLRYTGSSAPASVVLSPPLPVTIPPGGTQDIEVRFTPSNPGAVSETITLHVTTPCVDSTVYRLLGDVLAGVSARSLNLGVVPSCLPAAGGVMLRNHLAEAVQLAVLSFEGADASSMLVVSPSNLPVSIPAGDSLFVQIEFTANSGADHSYAAVLAATLRTATFDLTVRAPITVFAHSGGLSGAPVGNFGQVEIGGSGENRSFTFTNNAPFDVRIANPQVTGAAFTLIGTTPPLPLTLGPNESVDIGITFAPSVIGSFSGALLLDYVSPCVLTDSLLLSGEGFDSRIAVTVSLPGLAGAPDDIVEIPVRIDRDLGGKVSEWSGDIGYNASMLYPLDVRLSGTLSSGMRLREFTHDQLQGRMHLSVGDGAFLNGAGTIAIVRALVLIGDDVRTPLRCEESFTFGGGARVLDRIDGEFRLVNYCDADGSRLVQDRAGLRILSVSPNPLTDGVTIRYELDYDGPTDLRLFDLIGRERLLVVNENQLAGIHTVHARTANLPTGLYLCVLRHGGRTVTDKVIITR